MFLLHFFDAYVSIIYALQQFLVEMLFISYNSKSIMLYIILFFLGSVTIFTPCFISMLPLVLLYINSKSSFQHEVFLFILGVMTSFILLLLSTRWLNSFTIFSKLSIISYLTLILVSLDLMRVLRLSTLLYPITNSLNILTNQYTFLQNYCIGLVVGLSSIPCSTSILLIVNLLIFNIRDISVNFLCILVYFLGFTISFLLFTRANILYSKLASVYSIKLPITVLSGSLLFIFSISSILRLIFA